MTRIPNRTAIAVALLLAACGSRLDSGVAAAAPEVNRPGIDNPFQPLVPGTVWHYVGMLDGEPLLEIVEALEPERFAGMPECVPLEQRRFVAGDLFELTTEWFAADAVGDLWSFGEESWQVEEGVFVRSADSWRAGDGVAPVRVLPARPAAGQLHELVLPHGREWRAVVALDVAVDTPYAAFADCLEIHENPDDPDEDILLYAPGTGLAAQRAANGYKLLFDVERR